MRRVLLSLAFILLTNVVFCQNHSIQKPDYLSIKKAIQDSSSKFYYPRLMERMASFDSTLNREEYRHLYYGYLYHPDFEPYMTTLNDEKLVALYKRKDLKEIDYEKIIALASRLIASFPFDLQTVHILSNTYKLKGNLDMVKKLNERYFGILGAIYSSGDGKSKETAIHIIAINNENEILRQNNFVVVSRTKESEFDCFSILSGSRLQGRTINLYFYTGQIYNKDLITL
jgi:hypothetical protein